MTRLLLPYDVKNNDDDDDDDGDADDDEAVNQSPTNNVCVQE
jgi:hypothetical protein